MERPDSRMYTANSQMKMTLVLRFRINGNLRFLSHHESLSMFQRAFVRAKVDLCYSEGFNPRPKLSLPLPRSVGVASDDELLYALVVGGEVSSGVLALGERITRQLPTGCEIISVELLEKKTTFEATSAVYAFCLSQSACAEEITVKVENVRRALACGEVLTVERRAGPNQPCRAKDVSGYIDSVEFDAGRLMVKCNITRTGTVRVDEILQVLEIDSSILSGPVKRKSVQWKCN